MSCIKLLTYSDSFFDNNQIITNILIALFLHRWRAEDFRLRYFLKLFCLNQKDISMPSRDQVFFKLNGNGIEDAHLHKAKFVEGGSS